MELAGISVFVVEDEALVAMNLEGMLRGLGCSVLGPVMRLEQAERMLSEGLVCDAAILDVSLGGRAVFSLVEKLRTIEISDRLRHRLRPWGLAGAVARRACPAKAPTRRRTSPPNLPRYLSGAEVAPG